MWAPWTPHKQSLILFFKKCILMLYEQPEFEFSLFSKPSKVTAFYKGCMISAGDWHLEWFDKFVFLCYFFVVFIPSLKGGYLCSSSQFIIQSVLSSIRVLSADLMSFLWSSSFQMHWEALFLLGIDKQKQNWTIKKSHHFRCSTAVYFKIHPWTVAVGC